MSELSATDQRVINFLRSGRRLASAISKSCFPGKNTRPAVAHLHHMKKRELVQQVGSYWELTESAKDPSPELPLQDVES